MQVFPSLTPPPPPPPLPWAVCRLSHTLFLSFFAIYVSRQAAPSCFHLAFISLSPGAVTAIRFRRTERRCRKCYWELWKRRALYTLLKANIFNLQSWQYIFSPPAPSRIFFSLNWMSVSAVKYVLRSVDDSGEIYSTVFNKFKYRGGSNYKWS